MVTICLWQLVCLVAVIAVAYACFWVWKKFDTKVKAHRLAAFDVATMLSQHGCIRLPKILRSYATGDYIGAAQEVRKFMDAVESGVPVMEKEFDQVFDRVLASQLASPTGLIVIKAKLDEAMKVAKPAIDTVVKTAA
jgi:hypothetical protein